MTPEAQGAVERAAEVLADGLHAVCGCDSPLSFTRGEHLRCLSLAQDLAEALAAANVLATPPTASHDETALCEEGVYVTEYDFQPCERAAIAMRYDPEERTPYPVCRRHVRGDMVLLTAALAARAAAGADMAGESRGTS